MQTGAKIALVLACECHFSTERQETAVKPKPPIAWRARARAAHHTQPTHRTFARFTPALHRALRRMAGLVFLLVSWVLAGACQRHVVAARGGRVFIVQFFFFFGFLLLILLLLHTVHTHRPHAAGATPAAVERESHRKRNSRAGPTKF